MLRRQGDRGELGGQDPRGRHYMGKGGYRRSYIHSGLSRWLSVWLLGPHIPSLIHSTHSMCKALSCLYRMQGWTWWAQCLTSCSLCSITGLLASYAKLRDPGSFAHHGRLLSGCSGRVGSCKQGPPAAGWLRHLQPVHSQSACSALLQLLSLWLLHFYSWVDLKKRSNAQKYW